MAAEQTNGASGPTGERLKRRSLSREINEERLASQIAKRRQSEMLLAKARDELVLRELVEKQAGYLLVVLRQQILATPGSWAPKLVGLNSVEAVAEVLRHMTHAWLEQISDLPERVADEGWLDRLAEQEEKADG